MTRMVALLQGINVGGHRKVPMAELRALAAGLGLAQPRTYVASGNLVFDSDRRQDAIEAELEESLATTFGFRVPAVVRSAAQWRAYVAGNPFPEQSESQPNLVMIVVGKRKATDADVEAMMTKASPSERVARAGDVFWIWFGDGAGRSKLGRGSAREIWTTRNWRTVQAIHGMLEA